MHLKLLFFVVYRPIYEHHPCWDSVPLIDLHSAFWVGPICNAGGFGEAASGQVHFAEISTPILEKVIQFVYYKVNPWLIFLALTNPAHHAVRVFWVVGDFFSLPLYPLLEEPRCGKCFLLWRLLFRSYRSNTA